MAQLFGDLRESFFEIAGCVRAIKTRAAALRQVAQILRGADVIFMPTGARELPAHKWAERPATAPATGEPGERGRAENRRRRSAGPSPPSLIPFAVRLNGIDQPARFVDSADRARRAGQIAGRVHPIGEKHHRLPTLNFSESLGDHQVNGVVEPGRKTGSRSADRLAKLFPVAGKLRI